ncbi:MAG: type II secretion system protein GspG [Planctomycetota bacterium]
MADNANPTSGARGRGRAGFSLIELTLVIVILGILMGAAAVAFAPQIDRAKVRTTEVTLRTIKSKLQEYEGIYSVLPQDLSALVPDYVDEGGLEDGWNNAIYYRIQPTNPDQGFKLVSLGKDGKLNTEDDIDGWDPNLGSGN